MNLQRWTESERRNIALAKLQQRPMATREVGGQRSSRRTLQRRKATKEYSGASQHARREDRKPSASPGSGLA
jgi:hypothetical protein